MDTTVTLVAIVIAVAGATFILTRLQRSSRRSLADGERPDLPDPAARISADDARFRLLSFQGGSVPGDLGPILQDLRRNGIDIDEETLRRKLADGVASFAEVDGRQLELEDVQRRGQPATATLRSVTEDAAGVDHSTAGGAAAGKRLIVELDYHLPDGAPLRVRRAAVIPADRLDRMVQDSMIPIRVDDEHPELLTIEWELT